MAALGGPERHCNAAGLVLSQPRPDGGRGRPIRQALLPGTSSQDLIGTGPMQVHVPVALATLPGRMFPDAARRDNWVSGVLSDPKLADIPAILAVHPRARQVENYSFASYVAFNQDLFQFSASPRLALFHYLEFGVEEGRIAQPETVDPAYMEDRYRVSLPSGCTLGDALRLIGGPLAHVERKIYTSRDEMLIANGINGRTLLHDFDFEFYRASYLTDSREASFDECLEHFCETGQYRSFDVAEKLLFDPVFYGAEYRPPREELVAALPDRLRADVGLAPEADAPGTPAGPDAVALRRHWLYHGLLRAHAPNLRMAFKSIFQFDLADSLERTVMERVAAGADGGAAGLMPTEVARTFVDRPMDSLAPVRVCDHETARFLTAVADRHAVANAVGPADMLYGKVAEEFPAHWLATQHRADLLQRQGFLGLAADLRSSMVERGLGDRWTRLNLADCLYRLGRCNEAGAALNRAIAAFPQDLDLRRRARSMMRTRFQEDWDQRGEIARNSGIAFAQKRIADNLAHLTRSFSTHPCETPIDAVAIVAGLDIPQCALYRVTQKVEQLKAAGFRADVFDYTKDLPAFQAQLRHYQAVVFYRVPAFPNVIDAIVRASEFGLTTFYEIDDLTFDERVFPPPYETYAGAISPEFYADMACGVPLFRHAMSLCEFGIASTPTLQAAMSQVVRSGTVFLHRNAIGRIHQKAVDRIRRPKRLFQTRIFYGSGTKAHKRDFQALLAPALVAIARRHRRSVRIVIVGDVPRSTELEAISDQIEFVEPIWRFDEYLELLGSCDINLAVLEPTDLTDAKSEIKWLEAALFSIPSVVSPTATHREVVEDGVNGFLAGSAAEFETKIERLVRSRSLRRQIGDAARRTALAAYAPARMQDNIREIMRAVRPQPRTTSPAVPGRRKILVVNVFFPPYTVGGATRVVVDNVRDLRARHGTDYDIEVVCVEPGGEPRFAVDNYLFEGTRVLAINAPEMDWMIGANREMAKAFSHCLDIAEPDLVHFHCIQMLTASTIEVTLSRGIPYVITAHDGWWISPHLFINGPDDTPVTYEYAKAAANVAGEKVTDPRALLLKKPLFSAAAVCAVSPSFRELYLAAGVPDVLCTENGVSAFTPHERIRSPDGRVRLAHVGGAERHKGIHIVRDALRSHTFQNLSLTVIDHALPAGTVRRDRWGTTPVTFRARLDAEAMPAFYAETDVLIAPSTWPESYGLVTREALMAGAWVIASDRGAIGDAILEGENGFRVDVANHVGLARALAVVDGDPQTYLASPAVRPEIRPSTAQADELAALYARLLDGRAKAGRAAAS